MLWAIRNALGKPDLPLRDVLSSVYHSLAESYKRTVLELEAISGETVTGIAIVGGGCKDDYLNRLTAVYTGKPVSAGPVECTATGNILSQMIYLDPTLTPDGARDVVRKTWQDSIRVYKPE